MPLVFEKAQLSLRELARWDSAVARYWAVLRQNGLLAARDLPYAPVAGAEESSLFHRLLGGMPALKFPPPTSNGHPWYAVIEQPGPHVVKGVYVPAGGGGAVPHSVLLNHCEWALLDCNSAALELISLDKAVRGAVCSALPEAIRGRVLAAYAERPEMRVQFGKWPAFRLALAEGAPRVASRRHADAAMAGAVARKTFSSVFALDCLYANGRITETLACASQPQGEECPGDVVALVSDVWALSPVLAIEDCYASAD